MLRTVPHSSRGGGLYVLLADQITIGLLMARGDLLKILPLGNRCSSALPSLFVNSIPQIINIKKTNQKRLGNNS